MSEAWTTIDCPYPGLRPFRADENHLFFGREAQVCQLLKALRTQRMVAVLGTSGSGKSSLVRAGLLPELMGGTMNTAGAHWDVATMRPGGDPLLNLATALQAIREDDVDDDDLPRLMADLHRSSQGLVGAVRQCRLDGNGLILVDQFEEIFRFATERSREVAGEFINLLLEATRQRRVPIYVLLTMRTDFLGECAKFPGLAEAINHGHYLLPQLNREELRLAIEGPARVAGTEISGALTQHILNSVALDQDVLPVLQHGLMRTWKAWARSPNNPERIAVDDLRSIGSLDSALSQHVDEVYEALASNDQRQLAERVFKALTELGVENRAIRRPKSIGDLLAITDATHEQVTLVIDQFRREDCSFLTPPVPTELSLDTVVDISHESIMRCWDRLSVWVRDEAESADTYRRLRKSAALFEQGRGAACAEPELSSVLRWLDDAKPNPAWAAQYGGGFDEVVQFIETSKQLESHAASVALTTRADAYLRQAVENGSYNDFAKASSAFDEAVALYAENERAREGVLETRQAYARTAKSRQDLDLALSILERSPGQPFDASDPLYTELAQLVDRRAKQTRALKRAQWTILGLIAVSLLGLMFFSIWIWRERQIQVGLTELAQQKTLEAQTNEKQAQAARHEALANAEEAEKNALIATENELEANAARGEAERNARLAEQRATQNQALAERNREFANAARKNELKANEAARKALQVAYGSKLGLAGETIQRNGFDVATQILRELAQERVQRKLRHWEWGHLWALCQSQAARDFRTDKKKRLPRVEAVAMALPHGIVAAGAEDGNLFVWVEPKKQLVVCKHGPAIHAVAVSSDGRWIASGGVDEEQQFAIRLWDAEGNERARLTGHRAPVLGLTFSPDNAELLSASADGTARLWNLERFEGTAVLRGHQDNLRSARFSPDGAWIVTAADDRFVHIWSHENHNLVRRFVGHTGPVYDAAFTTDGTAVVSGGEDRRILIWRNLPQPEDTLPLVNRRIAEVERAIQLGDRASIAITRDFEILGAHDAAISSIRTANNLIFTTSHDNTSRVWRLGTSSPLKTLRGHGQWVRSCAPSSDGSRLLTGGYDGRVRLWNWQRYRLPYVLATADGNSGIPDRDLNSLAQSNDGNWIATGSARGHLTIWTVGDQATVGSTRLRQGHDWLATRGRFFDNGNRLLTAGGDNRAIIWDTRRGVELLRIGSNQSSLGGIGWYGVASVSTDGRLLVTGGDQANAPVKLWETHTGRSGWSREISTRVAQHLDGATAISVAAFSPQAGRSILVCDVFGTVYVIRTHDGALEHRFTGHQNSVVAASFSPDEKFVFTGSRDGTVRTWSTDSAQQLGAKVHSGQVATMCLSANGELMLTASRFGDDRDGREIEDDAIVHLWHPHRNDEPIKELSLTEILKQHSLGEVDKHVEATVRSAEFDDEASRALITTFVKRKSTGSSVFLVGEWQLEGRYQPFQSFDDIWSAGYAPRLHQAKHGEVMVVGGTGARILAKNGVISRRYEQRSSITSLAFSSDSRFLAVGDGEGAVALWQLVEGVWKPTSNSHPHAHPGGVQGMVFHPRLRDLLCTAGADGVIRLWRSDDTGELKLLDQQSAHAGPVQALAVATLTGSMLTLGNDGRALFWTVEDDKLQEADQPLTVESSGHCATLSSDGRWAAFGNGVNVTIWDVTKGALLGRLVGHLATVRSVGFAYDSRRVVTCGADSTVRIWDTNALTDAKSNEYAFSELLLLEEHRGSVNAAAFSPTGQHLVSAGSDGQTIVWPGVPIPPSITVSRDLLTMVGNNLDLTQDLRIVAPTMVDLSRAKLTVALATPSDVASNSLEESLHLALPEGFVFQNRSSARLVITRPAGYPACQTVMDCVRELRQWQQLARGLEYRSMWLSEQPSDADVATGRAVLIRMEGISLHDDSSEPPASMPPAEAEVSIRFLDRDEPIP